MKTASLSDNIQYHESRRTIQDVLDRKSTRLNSCHVRISYAVFCLKKKKKQSVLNRHYTDQCFHPYTHWIAGWVSHKDIPSPFVGSCGERVFEADTRP